MKMVARADGCFLADQRRVLTRCESTESPVGLAKSLGAGSGCPAPHFAAAVTRMRLRGVERGVRAVGVSRGLEKPFIEWMGKGV
jgi:hypothetical protein